MKTVLNVKTDKEVKEEAKKVAEELGVPLSVIVNAYLKQFVRNKEVYLSTAPYMLPELEQLLGLVEDDIQHRRNLSPTLSTQKALDEYLSRLWRSTFIKILRSSLKDYEEMNKNELENDYNFLSKINSYPY